MNKVKSVNVMLGGQKPSKLDKDKIWIGVDSGADFLFEKGVNPEYILGDLDSVDIDNLSTSQVIKKNNQDLTDTEFALDWIVENFLELETINLYGATGLRLDHFFANILLLSKASYKKLKINIIDDNNIIFLSKIGMTLLEKIESYKYISFVPIKDNTRITIDGAKYSVDNMYLSIDRANATSNEFVNEEISITTNNQCLVIYSKDDK
ncbi:MAG: thiamine diphosphokinase [Gemella sp.]|nr:thiamine diphosphokinase [Gemella sp.]